MVIYGDLWGMFVVFPWFYHGFTHINGAFPMASHGPSPILPGLGGEVGTSGGGVRSGAGGEGRSHGGGGALPAEAGHGAEARNEGETTF